MEKVLEFGGAALAAFVGTGAAVLVLRWLSKTLVGNWLAKGLARYTAQVETGELPNRLAIERVHAKRAEYIDRLMSRMPEWFDLAKFHVHAEGSGAGMSAQSIPFVALLRRTSDLSHALRKMERDIDTSAYVFTADDPMVELTMTMLETMRKHTEDLLKKTMARLGSSDLESMSGTDAWVEVRTTHSTWVAELESVTDPSELLARCREHIHPKV